MCGSCAGVAYRWLFVSVSSSTTGSGEGPGSREGPSSAVAGQVALGCHQMTKTSQEGVLASTHTQDRWVFLKWSLLGCIPCASKLSHGFGCSEELGVLQILRWYLWKCVDLALEASILILTVLFQLEIFCNFCTEQDGSCSGGLQTGLCSMHRGTGGQQQSEVVTCHV